VRFAHRHGIVHRDIKPHNVLVDTEGRLKVTDFGIARAGTSQMTEAGSIIGTAQYLSPEQARGAPVDQTSDLYSVGVVLYELLTGVVQFSGAAIIGGDFLYSQVERQLTNSKVAVEEYRGLREIDAVKKVRDKGLRVQVVRQYSEKTPETFVFKQDPQPGEHIDKGNYVT